MVDKNATLKDTVNVFIPHTRKCRLCQAEFFVASVWKESLYCEYCLANVLKRLDYPMKTILEHLLSRIESLEKKP